MFTQEKIAEYKEKHPLLTKILNLNPVLWENPNVQKMSHIDSLSLGMEDMLQAEDLWYRFSSFFENEFPVTAKSNGIIESPLKKINVMNESLARKLGKNIHGDLYLKCDNELPIAGSIKARGGFYEVLYYAESLAKKAGLINDETTSYDIFSNKEFKDLFSQYSIGVGSTGNLGISIGIMSAKLGFDVSVYMSRDAKQWKKDLLRKKGATVFEFDGDFSQAIALGRQEISEKPNGYFVDDEDSKLLFLGYSTAAFRLKKQLEDRNITVDEDHPLFMYLPCGVGGSPGGITFGMKQIYGDNVHCFFNEPLHSPSNLIGLLTEEKNGVSVQDFGIDNRTEADGLAVGRPSKFASIFSEKLVSGIYTLGDETIFKLHSLLADTEGIRLEPSGTGGIIGPYKVENSTYMEQHNIDPRTVTHLAWATGGGLVPEEEMEVFYQTGLKYLQG